MTNKWVSASLAGLVALAACSRRDVSDLSIAPPPTRTEIWVAIQPLATRYRLEPGFIYALVIAESNANPRARNGDARGLMQLQPAAWRAVSSAPYEPAVWEWRANLTAGVDFLAYSRAYLHRRKGVTFSYPLLLAAFHYGLAYVEERDFDVSRVSIPDNAIYRELWRGNFNPVPPPE
jgi:soluble lytic murein transglycosylase-like protein